jgi:hypothetical protein
VSYHVVPGYRVSERYLRWKALRNGGHVARRNHGARGRLAFLAGLAARVGQAALLHLPRLWGAWLAGDPGRALGARCRLWRSEGYVRFALHLLAPRLFPQRRFFAGLEFRTERELFGEPAGPPRRPVRTAAGPAGVEVGGAPR